MTKSILFFTLLILSCGCKKNTTDGEYSSSQDEL
jgi:hypothetical protein